MSFSNQVIDLLSQSPGSLIYHFGILFAIEATLGMTLGHRGLPAIRRAALAAAGMLILRLGLMVVALLDYSGVISNPAVVMPPLERAVDATSLWLLIWALLPLSSRMPQWGDLLAGAGLLLLVVLYVFFGVAWYDEAGGRTVAPAYNASYQDAFWEVVQLVLLGAALVYVLAVRSGDWGLQLGILLVLSAAHLVHLSWGPNSGNVAGWVRLGQLVAYPLLTVGAYRMVINHLMEGIHLVHPAPGAVAPLDQIRQVAMVTGLTDESALVRTAISTIARLSGADVVALLQLVGEPGSGIELEKVAIYRDGQPSLTDRSRFLVDDAPALRRVINDEQALFLRPDGSDDLSRLSLMVQLLPEIDREDRLGAYLLLQPVSEEKKLFGALLVVFTDAAQVADDRIGAKRQLIDLLSLQLARGLGQVRMLTRLGEQVTRTTAQLRAVDGSASERLAKLQAELFETRRSERELARQIDKMQAELQQAHKRSDDLAAPTEKRPAAEANSRADTLGESQQADILEPHGQLGTLAAELDSGESATPDRPKSYAARGGPPPVLRTGEKADHGPADNLVQELRQPIASIVGYTDLLMGESIGTVGDLQRVFLERVKASSERARALLDDLVQVIDPSDEPLLLDLEPVRFGALVQSAIDGFADQVAEKELDLQLSLVEPLPTVEVDRDVLDQVIHQLLLNALRVTPSGKQVSVEVRYQNGDAAGDKANDRVQGYIFMSVRDTGGGIALADQSHVFDRLSRANGPPIAGLRDSGMGLPLVSELVKAHGGRVWLESEPKVGSTFSVVLPVSVVDGAT